MPLGIVLLFALETGASAALAAPGATAFASDDSDDDSHDQLLAGVRLPGLIDTEGLDVGLETYGLYGAEGEVTLDEASLTLLGDITHVFEGEVQDLKVSLALFEAGQATFVEDRLTKPPLQLSQADLDDPLPSPLASPESVVLAENLDAGAPTRVDLLHPLGEITVSANDPPEYLLVVEDYSLNMPTVADIERILRQGGVADHAALAEWAAEHRDTGVPFTQEERAQVMAEVRTRFRRLRAPPALGDFQRLRAMVELIRVMAAPGDVEALLKLERPMRILHTSAVLSYNQALREETNLGLPVHGMHRLPPQSDFMAAAESAYRSLRPMALGKLLRLAFDPLDFRDAPASMTKHRLRRQAEVMLSPLRPTDVAAVLGAAAGNPDVEREVLRFYLDVRYAPVTEPLVDWLAEHPRDVDDLGAQAVRELPQAVLPAALQRYVDPRDPEHRAVMRGLLENMPAQSAPVIIDALGSLGVPLAVDDELAGPDAVSRVLDGFEQVERNLAGQRAAALIARLEATEPDAPSLKAALRDAGRLAQVAPHEVAGVADVLLDLHAKAALEFDEDAPTERTRALRQLQQLPWGDRAADAKRVHATTEAQLLVQRREVPEALERLLAFDEELSHPEVRSLFAGTIEQRYTSQIESGNYDGASQTLASAEEHVPEDVPLEQMRRELSMHRYRPAYIVGGLFGLLIVSSMWWLVIRGTRRGLKRWRASRKELNRLMRRQWDAEASADEAAMFDAEDSGTRVSQFDPASADIGPPPDAEEDLEAPEPSQSSAATHSSQSNGPVLSLEPSDDLLDDPFADALDWDQPFADDILGEEPREAALD